MGYFMSRLLDIFAAGLWSKLIAVPIGKIDPYANYGLRLLMVVGVPVFYSTLTFSCIKNWLRVREINNKKSLKLSKPLIRAIAYQAVFVSTKGRYKSLRVKPLTITVKPYGKESKFFSSVINMLMSVYHKLLVFGTSDSVVGINIDKERITRVWIDDIEHYTFISPSDEQIISAEAPATVGLSFAVLQAIWGIWNLIHTDNTDEISVFIGSFLPSVIILTLSLPIIRRYNAIIMAGFEGDVALDELHRLNNQIRSKNYILQRINLNFFGIFRIYNLQLNNNTMTDSSAVCAISALELLITSLMLFCMTLEGNAKEMSRTIIAGNILFGIIYISACVFWLVLRMTYRFRFGGMSAGIIVTMLFAVGFVASPLVILNRFELFILLFTPSPSNLNACFSRYITSIFYVDTKNDTINCINHSF
jgi:hypothetical protein